MTCSPCVITGTRRVRCGVPGGKSVSKDEQPGEWLGTHALLRKLALTQIPCWSVQLSHPPSPPHPCQGSLGLLLGSRRRATAVFPALCCPFTLLSVRSGISLISNHPWRSPIGGKGTGECRTLFLLLSPLWMF